MAGTGVLTIQVDIAMCKGCNLCIEVCPREVLAVSTTRGAQGALIVEPRAPERCTGCRICELTCPDFAIVVSGGAR